MDASAWDDRYAAHELVWGGAPNRWVAQETGELPVGRALDLAAGEGRNAIWLAERGWRVTAVDFSEVALDRARRLATTDRPPEVAERIEWVRADVLSYEPAPGGFDLVVLAYLQLPEAERVPVWRRAAAAVAPGGSMLVVGHDSTNLSEGTGGPQDPSVLYTPADVLTAVADAELKTVRANQVRRPVEKDGGVVDAIDALVLLRREG
ncbi:class I SAM-dependent methyltransferase [Streptomyces sp. A7024]|uniref:Class I SAM-dependent methyltransferase n=1 Tax=Streptomyces coryli TaxID=1128680 RepID=A0A6G4TR86_9ACTN|nr:class I SAM-dependent methyltransferase [Streptomyces coryli]NGN62302.1 class I SAM-dependent methyltransferase [Streptomyces coryli]